MTGGAGPRWGSCSVSPFLTIAEAAEFVRVSPKRIRNLMADGTLREGQHFVRPKGLGPRFRRDALMDWLDPPQLDHANAIPMARRGARRVADTTYRAI